MTTETRKESQESALDSERRSRVRAVHREEAREIGRSALIQFGLAAACLLFSVLLFSADSMWSGMGFPLLILALIFLLLAILDWRIRRDILQGDWDFYPPRFDSPSQTVRVDQSRDK